MKKNSIYLLLIILSSFLLIKNVESKGEFDTTFLKNTTFLNDDIFARKMNDSSVNDILYSGGFSYKLVGYLATVGYYENGSSSNFHVLKQKLYITKDRISTSNNSLNPFPTKNGSYDIKIKSKFGNFIYNGSDNSGKNIVKTNVPPSDNELTNLAYDAITIGSMYMYSNYLNDGISAINTCYMFAFVEPIYYKTKNSAISHDYESMCRFNYNTTNGLCINYNSCIRDKQCNRKDCLNVACGNNEFNNVCSTQCTIYQNDSAADLNSITSSPTVAAYNISDNNIGVSFSSSNQNGDFYTSILPSINLYDRNNQKLPQSSLSSGWGFSKIIYISPDKLQGVKTHEKANSLDFYSNELNVYEYCMYNVATCENGELIGSCLKESKYTEAAKLENSCPSSSWRVEGDKCYYDISNPISSFCSNGATLTYVGGVPTCIQYATERYICNDPKIEDSKIMGQTVNSADYVCDTLINSKEKCPKGTVKSADKSTCVSKKKSNFSCSSGTLQCKTGYIGRDGASVKECQCLVTSGGYYTTYKLQTAEDCKGRAGGNQAECENCRYGPNGGSDNSCGGTNQVCCAITSGSPKTTSEVPAKCSSGYTVTTGGVDNTGHKYVRCKIDPIDKETEIDIYPNLVYDCPSNYGGDNPICSIVEPTFYYPACQSGYVPVGDGSVCRRYVSKGSYCPDGYREKDGKCIREKNFNEVINTCKNEYICKSVCPNDSNIDLSSCISDAKKDGIYIGDKGPYKATTYAGARNICRIKECGEINCDSENEALQKKANSSDKLKQCILDSGNQILLATNDAAINKIVNECKPNVCKRQCYTSRLDGTQPLCDGYDKSQSINYFELEPNNETNLNICENQSPRVSKYGRLIKSTSSCNLFCTQSTNILLPTNKKDSLNKLSYFEWPEKIGDNILKITTYNECYLFTKEEMKQEDFNSKKSEIETTCGIDSTNINDILKSVDEPGVELNDNIILEEIDSSKELEDNIVINPNVNNPISFKYTVTKKFIIPKDNNNYIVVNKANGDKDDITLDYGVIQIGEDEPIGEKKLKLNFSNYGFENQFGKIINGAQNTGYVCKYNVANDSKIICENKCVGKLSLKKEDNFTTTKVKVESYNNNNNNNICDYKFTCKEISGYENALYNCIMSYFKYNKIEYNAKNIDASNFKKAINHCSRICDNTDPQKVIFRQISTKNPFPGMGGLNRVPGSNWVDNIDIAKNDDKSDALYVITLTSNNIKNIRNYNKTYDYDNWTINKITGLSPFIRNDLYVKNIKYNASKKTSAIEVSCRKAD